MGPFAMADLAGLDVGWRNRQSRLQNLTPRERECDMLDRMVAAGRLGQKTQGGFYDYDSERKATPSPAAEALVAAHRAASGRQARQISDQEILERCLYSMINEAAYILEENIVERASDIDVVWLKGYGFPAHRGGPLCYADQIGLPAILAGLRQYEAEHGSQYWKPANLIVKLAQEGRGFHDGPA
jgi:3-hydroxyacyl-CoA dehydrogenase